MSSPSIPVTVVVPVKNEEANLARCLSHLGRFSEILVVDSSSTDRTREIALEYKSTLINFEWNGLFPKKRNWVLLNYCFANKWVLFLDADEIVDNSFCEAVSVAIKVDGVVGYWLRYSNWFLGRPLRHGVPQRKLALFKVGAGLYERIDEDRWSHLDMEVHEHPIIAGALGEIAAPIQHNDFRGIDKFLDRHRDYARWESKRFMLLEKEGLSSTLTWRQRFKYRYISKNWYPWWYFVYTYIVRLGVLDGVAGLHYAGYKLWYFMTVGLLIRELRDAALSSSIEDGYRVADAGGEGGGKVVRKP